MTTPALILNATVVQGALDPEALVIEVYPTDEVPDLSVVTTASLYVIRGSGSPETWTCTITTKTSTLLVLTHPYVATDTATANERMRIYAMCSAAAWTNPRRAQMCQLLVTAE